MSALQTGVSLVGATIGLWAWLRNNRYNGVEATVSQRVPGSQPLQHTETSVSNAST